MEKVEFVGTPNLKRALDLLLRFEGERYGAVVKAVSKTSKSA